MALDEEKAATSDEDKLTGSSIQENADERKDVSVPKQASHLELIFLGRRMFVTQRRILKSSEEPHIVVSASKSIQESTAESRSGDISRNQH